MPRLDIEFVIISIGLSFQQVYLKVHTETIDRFLGQTLPLSLEASTCQFLAQRHLRSLFQDLDYFSYDAIYVVLMVNLG